MFAEYPQEVAEVIGAAKRGLGGEVVHDGAVRKLVQAAQQELLALLVGLAAGRPRAEIALGLQVSEGPRPVEGRTLLARRRDQWLLGAGVMAAACPEHKAQT